LFGAVILGLARAAGETMAVLMVMGSTPTLTASPLNAGATMASTLAGEFPEAATNDLYRGALMELALILLLMSLAFNIVARYLVVGNAVRPSAGY
jgi:phosphate transport system permease protein